MAQKSEQPGNAKMSPATEHKGSSVALPKFQWFIAECKPTRERTIREMLKKVGYEAYVASQKEKHRYASGNTRITEHVILSGKIFVHIEKSSIADILNTFSPIYRFQINRAAKEDRFGNKPFAYVPMEEMDRFMELLEKSEKPIVITDERLKLNQKVKIIRGPLQGFEGRYYRKGSSSYIVITIDMGGCHYVYTEVSLNDIQICSPNSQT